GQGDRPVSGVRPATARQNPRENVMTMAAPSLIPARSPVAARSLISINDVTDEELYSIVQRGVDFAAGDVSRPLADRVVGIYFAKTSTRTRTAFSSGALRLGAGIVTFGPADLQLNTGESWEDTGRVFAGMLDIMVMRT